jgi:F-type H+-transporting ATPase subunit c
MVIKKDFFSCDHACLWATKNTLNQKTNKQMINIIAEISGSVGVAGALLGAPLGVGLIGMKAAEAVGRNPGAATKILIQSILGMALAEGLGILAMLFVK